MLPGAGSLARLGTLARAVSTLALSAALAVLAFAGVGLARLRTLARAVSTLALSAARTVFALAGLRLTVIHREGRRTAQNQRECERQKRQYLKLGLHEMFLTR